MCFGGSDDPAPVVPEAPAETLEQEAPVKQDKNSDKAKKLSIGSKKYATTNPSATATQGYTNVSN